MKRHVKALVLAGMAALAAGLCLVWAGSSGSDESEFQLQITPSGTKVICVGPAGSTVTYRADLTCDTLSPVPSHIVYITYAGNPGHPAWGTNSASIAVPTSVTGEIQVDAWCDVDSDTATLVVTKVVSVIASPLAIVLPEGKTVDVKYTAETEPAGYANQAPISWAGEGVQQGATGGNVTVTYDSSGWKHVIATCGAEAEGKAAVVQVLVDEEKSDPDAPVYGKGPSPIHAKGEPGGGTYSWDGPDLKDTGNVPVTQIEATQVGAALITVKYDFTYQGITVYSTDTWTVARWDFLITAAPYQGPGAVTLQQQKAGGEEPPPASPITTPSDKQVQLKGDMVYPPADVTKWDWSVTGGLGSFLDPETGQPASNIANPVFVPKKGGRGTITLKVTDKTGNTKTHERPLTVVDLNYGVLSTWDTLTFKWTDITVIGTVTPNDLGDVLIRVTCTDDSPHTPRVQTVRAQVEKVGNSDTGTFTAKVHFTFTQTGPEWLEPMGSRFKIEAVYGPATLVREKTVQEELPPKPPK